MTKSLSHPSSQNSILSMQYSNQSVSQPKNAQKSKRQSTIINQSIIDKLHPPTIRLPQSKTLLRTLRLSLGLSLRLTRCRALSLSGLLGINLETRNSSKLIQLLWEIRDEMIEAEMREWGDGIVDCTGAVCRREIR